MSDIFILLIKTSSPEMLWNKKVLIRIFLGRANLILISLYTIVKKSIGSMLKAKKKS